MSNVRMAHLPCLAFRSEYQVSSAAHFSKIDTIHDSTIWCNEYSDQIHIWSTSQSLQMELPRERITFWLEEKWPTGTALSQRNRPLHPIIISNSFGNSHGDHLGAHGPGKETPERLLVRAEEDQSKEGIMGGKGEKKRPHVPSNCSCVYLNTCTARMWGLQYLYGSFKICSLISLWDELMRIEKNT
jgi:hypothetical protein